MLPTEDKSIPFNLHKCIKYYKDTVLPGENLMEDDIHNVGELDVLLSKYADNDYWEPQYLYITVSQDVEPIKEGDWYLYDSKIWNQKECVPKYHSLYGRKIIATTDTKLTKGRVIIGTGGTLYKRIAQPSKSFLKEFFDNPNGEFEVEYEVAGSRGNTTIPELFYNLKLNQDNTVNIISVEEKMYSRDDLWKTVAQSHIARKSMQNVFNDLPNWFDNWIKENL